MTYFGKVCANSLFAQGHKPQGFIDKDGEPHVGFGKFNSLNYTYEYPLDAIVLKGKISCRKWKFDNTNVIYNLTCNGNQRLRYHGTLEQLFHSSEPYIFKLDMKKVKECLESGEDFVFQDNSYDHYEVIISKK